MARRTQLILAGLACAALLGTSISLLTTAPKASHAHAVPNNSIPEPTPTRG